MNWKCSSELLSVFRFYNCLADRGFGHKYIDFYPHFFYVFACQFTDILRGWANSKTKCQTDTPSDRRAKCRNAKIMAKNKTGCCCSTDLEINYWKQQKETQLIFCEWGIGYKRRYLCRIDREEKYLMSKIKALFFISSENLYINMYG